MGMGLQERRAGAYHFSTLAPGVARRTDRIQTPLWRGQLRTLRQCALPCSLSRAVQIEDHPSLSLPIPQTTYTLGWSRAGERVLQEHTAQRFHTCLIQGSKKTAECRAMRQLRASEQGHERSRKRLQALVIGCQCRLSTERIAHQHDEKVDHLIGPEPFAHEANTLRDFGKQAQTGQGVGEECHFLEYLIMPLSLIVWLVEAIREAVSHLLLRSIPSRASCCPAALQGACPFSAR